VPEAQAVNIRNRSINALAGTNLTVGTATRRS
jgi:hypothetical protein